MDTGESKVNSVECMKTKLDEALDFIELKKEAENYKIYCFLKRLLAKSYGISVQSLESSQDFKSAEARMVFLYLLKNHTDYSYRLMSILLGAKQHSQIHHSIKLLNAYFEKNLYHSTILTNCLEAEKSLINFLESNAR